MRVSPRFVSFETIFTSLTCLIETHPELSERRLHSVLTSRTARKKGQVNRPELKSGTTCLALENEPSAVNSNEFSMKSTELHITFYEALQSSAT